jgi:hypothetical protein
MKIDIDTLTEAELIDLNNSSPTVTGPPPWWPIDRHSR